MLSENAKNILNVGSDSDAESLVRKTTLDLLRYCIRNNWSGYDPFDGLNSRIFSRLPFSKSSLARLAFIQSFKRLPINLRPLFLVPKGVNPKGLAVFSSALINLSQCGLIHDDSLIRTLLEQMIKLRSPGPHYCWGYNFDWQTRVSLVKKFSPNIICTTFAGNALLDAYGRFGDREYLDMAASAGDFILKELKITGSGDEICFSYTPLHQDQVHNANLLGASYLARLYGITGETGYYGPACSAVRYSVRRQMTDGSWAYGESGKQRWVDNFHTGYNLLALKRFSEYTGNDEYKYNITKGFQYYRENFFTPEGLPKYYNNRTYPIDIHAVSQSIVTLMEFRDLGDDNTDLALRVLGWALKEMKSREGFFYYQKKRFYKNRIPYARWSQAWMLYSLSTLQLGLSVARESADAAGKF